MTTVLLGGTGQKWASTAPSGWAKSPNFSTNASVISDTTEIDYNPVGVECKCDAGTPGGSGDVDYNYDITANGGRVVTLEQTLRIDPNYSGHSGGVNKFGGLAKNGGSLDAFFNASGNGLNALAASLGVQGVAAWPSQPTWVPSGFPTANMASIVLQRGQWFRWAMRLTVNSGTGVNDGGIEVWVNGRKTHEYLNQIGWISGAGTYRVTNISNVYVWGGGGGTTPYDMFRRFSRHYAEADASFVPYRGKLRAGAM